MKFDELNIFTQAIVKLQRIPIPSSLKKIEKLENRGVSLSDIDKYNIMFNPLRNKLIARFMHASLTNTNCITFLPRKMYDEYLSIPMFIAASICTVKDTDIAVFAPSNRLTVTLKEQTELYVNYLNEDPRKMSVVSFYNTSVDILDNVSAKTIICYNLRQIDDKVWRQIIKPLVEKSGSQIFSVGGVPKSEHISDFKFRSDTRVLTDYSSSVLFNRPSL